jgi:hypothetical protein
MEVGGIGLDSARGFTIGGHIDATGFLRFGLGAAWFRCRGDEQQGR